LQLKLIYIIQLLLQLQLTEGTLLNLTTFHLVTYSLDLSTAPRRVAPCQFIGSITSHHSRGTISLASLSASPETERAMRLGAVCGRSVGRWEVHAAARLTECLTVPGPVQLYAPLTTTSALSLSFSLSLPVCLSVMSLSPWSSPDRLDGRQRRSLDLRRHCSVCSLTSRRQY